MSFGRIKSEDQLIFLNTGQVLGIQDFSIQENFGASTLKYIGQGNKSLNQISNSPQYADLSLNGLLIDSDKFIIQTGIQPINCFILKNNPGLSSSYSLLSGYMTNYTAKFSPNQIPQIASNFRFYNNAGYIYNDSNFEQLLLSGTSYYKGAISQELNLIYPVTSYYFDIGTDTVSFVFEGSNNLSDWTIIDSHMSVSSNLYRVPFIVYYLYYRVRITTSGTFVYDLTLYRGLPKQLTFNEEIANTNYINLTLDEYNTNRVQDFNLSLDFNRLPIYNVGSRSPKRVDLVYPINVGCNISFEVDNNYSGIALQDFPANKIKQNITVDVYNNKSETRMASYSFVNATLISEKSSLNVDGNLILNRNYIGQIFRYNGQDNIVSDSVYDFGFVSQSPDYYIDWRYVSEPFTSGWDLGVL